MPTILLFNKPFQVLSQFTDPDGRRTLAEFIPQKKVRPAGRLDYDSEGLLVLSDSGDVIHRLTQPDKGTTKTYWAQVEGAPTHSDLSPLTVGIELNDGLTRPARFELLDRPHLIWDRTPPIRERRNKPTQWISLTLSEGRNRQVRRMLAAVGFPVLRLIRYRVGSWTLDGLAPGKIRAVPSRST